MMLVGEVLHSSTGQVALESQVQKTRETQVPDKTSSLRHLFWDHPSSKMIQVLSFQFHVSNNDIKIDNIFVNHYRKYIPVDLSKMKKPPQEVLGQVVIPESVAT